MYKRKCQGLAGSLEFFQDSRALEEARNFFKSQEYEEIRRKYEEI